MHLGVRGQRDGSGLDEEGRVVVRVRRAGQQGDVQLLDERLDAASAAGPADGIARQGGFGPDQQFGIALGRLAREGDKGCETALQPVGPPLVGVRDVRLDQADAQALGRDGRSQRVLRVEPRQEVAQGKAREEDASLDERQVEQRVEADDPAGDAKDAGPGGVLDEMGEGCLAVPQQEPGKPQLPEGE